MDEKVRLKRYLVKEGHSITLKADMIDGTKMELPVFDVSVNSCGARCEHIPDALEDGIITLGTLFFENNPILIGRMVASRVDRAKNTLGFVAIDGRIPIESTLSKAIEFSMDGDNDIFASEISAEYFNVANFVNAQYLNVDILHRTSTFSKFYESWKKTDKFGYFLERQPSIGSRPILNTNKRKNGRKDFLMVGSNDYLGLSSHPEVVAAAIEATKLYGFGSTGTPPTSGHTSLHHALEQKIATLFKQEDAVLYASGFAANTGCIGYLCREGDLIIADQLSHASMIEGMAASRAKCIVFKHNDMASLEEKLQEHRASYNGCLILTEGVFSMDGSIGKLDQIHALSRQYQARYYIDQGHCVGVLGEKGLGAVEKYGLIGRTDILMGLLSKALGGIGGYVTGTKALCNWLRVFSKPYLFATSFPPAAAAAAIKSLDLIQSTDIVAQLRRNIEHFRRNLCDIGYYNTNETAIFPVEIRNERKLGRIYKSLLEDGIFVLPVVYPVVSRDRCRLRISIRRDLTITDLDYITSSLEKAAKNADLNFSEISPKV